MMPDEKLQHILDRIEAHAPGDGAAARIVRHVTALPQRRRTMAITVLDRLSSPWPDDLMPKAGALALVALVTFGIGLSQGTGTHHGGDILSLAYGDIDESEAL